MADLDWQQIVKALGATIAASLGASGAIWKYLDWRREQQKSVMSLQTDRERLAIEQAKLEGEADDRLIKALMDEREKTAARYEARIQFLETQLHEEQRLREEQRDRHQEQRATLMQTNAEYQMQIQMLTRQIDAMEKKGKG